MKNSRVIRAGRRTVGKRARDTLAWKEFAAFVATMSRKKYERQLLEKC